MIATIKGNGNNDLINAAIHHGEIYVSPNSRCHFYSWGRERESCIQSQHLFSFLCRAPAESKVYCRKCFSIDPLLPLHISSTPSALLFLSFISSPSAGQPLHSEPYLMDIAAESIHLGLGSTSDVKMSPFGSRLLCQFFDSLSASQSCYYLSMLVLCVSVYIFLRMDL